MDKIKLGIVSSFVFGFLSLFVACQTAQKIPPLYDQRGQAEDSADSTRNETIEVLDTMGPPEPYGPLFIKMPSEEKPLVIVLGPGLARGFAHVGVLQALYQAKIPIGAILGTEMGALIGAIYSTSSTMNQFEWALQYLKKDSFVKPKGFLTKNILEPHEGIKLDQQLQKIFGKKRFQDAKTPLKIALESEATGISFIVQEGALAPAVRGALNAPRLLTSTRLLIGREEIGVVAATKTKPFLIQEAKDLNLGPVLVINVLSKNESSFVSNELNKADLILEPDLKDIDYFDYNKKNEIIYRGRKVVQEKLNDIKKIIGFSID